LFPAEICYFIVFSLPPISRALPLYLVSDFSHPPPPGISPYPVLMRNGGPSPGREDPSAPLFFPQQAPPTGGRLPLLHLVQSLFFPSLATVFFFQHSSTLILHMDRNGPREFSLLLFLRVRSWQTVSSEPVWMSFDQEANCLPSFSFAVSWRLPLFIRSTEVLLDREGGWPFPVLPPHSRPLTFQVRLSFLSQTQRRLSVFPSDFFYPTKGFPPGSYLVEKEGLYFPPHPAYVHTSPASPSLSDVQFPFRSRQRPPRKQLVTLPPQKMKPQLPPITILRGLIPLDSAHSPSTLLRGLPRAGAPSETEGTLSIPPLADETQFPTLFLLFLVSLPVAFVIIIPLPYDMSRFVPATSIDAG